MTINSRLTRLERQLGLAHPAQTRIDLIRKAKTGEVGERDLHALHQLMKDELRISLLLAAGALQARCNDLAASFDRTAAPRRWPSAAPMVYATAIVATPLDLSPDPDWAEGLRVFSHNANAPVNGGGPRRGLSAPEQLQVALWLRANLLTATLGEPAGLALRRTLATEWADGPRRAELSSPGLEHAGWLAKMERVLWVPGDMPIVRGRKAQVWERDWTGDPLYTDGGEDMSNAHSRE